MDIKGSKKLYVFYKVFIIFIFKLENWKKAGDFAKWNDKYLVKMHKSGNGEYEKIIAFIVVSC